MKPTSQTLPQLLEELSEKFGDRPAVTFEGVTLTFSETRRQALDLAKSLIQAGIGKGDKVGILMGNRTEWLIANFAIQYSGATMVALNTWYKPSELEYVVEHAELRGLFSAERYIKSDYVQILGDLTRKNEFFAKISPLVLLGDRQIPNSVAYDNFIDAHEGISDRDVLERASQSHPDDVAFLLYTSGSTSHPKGVELLHRRLIENPYNIGERLHFTTDDTFYMPISLFWGLGCENMLMACWTHAMHIVLQDQFDPLGALQLIDRYKCTALAGTPNIIHAIFKHPERSKYDISSLRKGTASGSPEQTREVIETAMPLACHCYGLTESYGFATVNDASDPVEKRCISEGRVLPGTDLRIINPDTDEEVPAGEVGEVRLKGHILLRYYKNEAATAAAFDRNGYFRTGDLAALDNEGYLIFKGRLKEMLKTGGINVAPIEVEEIIRQHPAVEEAYVTGLPDDVQDEIVAAVVVPKSPDAISELELREYCKSAMASYKVPKAFKIVSMDQIPLTSTSKVHKLRLKELFGFKKDKAL